MIDSMAQWAKIATAKIPYKPDREKAFQELFAHMADSKDYYVEHGLSQGEAIVKSVAQMGDPAETAQDLGKMYHSLWYSIAKVTWVFAIIALVIMAFIGFLFLGDFFHSHPQAPGDAGASYPYPIVAEANPNQSISYGGYTITANRVTLYDLVDGLGATVQLDITFLDPYMGNPDFAEHLSLMDNLGNYYHNSQDILVPEHHVLHSNFAENGMFSNTCILRCEGVPLGRWPVAVHYERSGISWTLPLEVSP